MATRDNRQEAPKKGDFRLGCHSSTVLSHLQGPTHTRRVPCSGCHTEGKRALKILSSKAPKLVSRLNPKRRAMVRMESGSVGVRCTLMNPSLMKSSIARHSMPSVANECVPLVNRQRSQIGTPGTRRRTAFVQYHVGYQLLRVVAAAESIAEG